MRGLDGDGDGAGAADSGWLARCNIGAGAGCVVRWSYSITPAAPIMLPVVRIAAPSCAR